MSPERGDGSYVYVRPSPSPSDEAPAGMSRLRYMHGAEIFAGRLEGGVPAIPFARVLPSHARTQIAASIAAVNNL